MLDNDRARAAAAVVVEPIARGFLRIGVTANAVTIATALTTSVIAIVTFGRGEFGWGLLLGLPFAFGDLLDGTMARLSGSHSRWGSFLDSVMDRMTDAAIFGSVSYWLAVTGQWPAFSAALWALASAFIISYIRAKADAVGVGGKVGLMERAERLALLAVAAVVAALGWTPAVAYACYLLAGLNSFTIWQRMAAVRRGLEDASG